MSSVWHCPVCSKSWNVKDLDDGTPVVSFWHKCIERYAGDEDYSPRRFRLGEDRGPVWFALLEQVGEEELWRR